MIRIFKTEDGAMHEKEEMQPGCWIALTNPTASEIIDIADTYQIDPDHLRAPLDEEERSRIEVEDEYTLILVDIPSIEERNGKDWFVTIPSGYHHHQGCADYGLPGGDACAHFLYGRKGEGFPHLHENQVYPADSL